MNKLVMSKILKLSTSIEFIGVVLYANDNVNWYMFFLYFGVVAAWHLMYEHLLAIADYEPAISLEKKRRKDE